MGDVPGLEAAASRRQPSWRARPTPAPEEVMARPAQMALLDAGAPWAPGAQFAWWSIVGPWPSRPALYRPDSQRRCLEIRFTARRTTPLSKQHW